MDADDWGTLIAFLVLGRSWKLHISWGRGKDGVIMDDYVEPEFVPPADLMQAAWRLGSAIGFARVAREMVLGMDKSDARYDALKVLERILTALNTATIPGDGA